jgi:hypothetical protein
MLIAVFSGEGSIISEEITSEIIFQAARRRRKEIIVYIPSWRKKEGFLVIEVFIRHFAPDIFR